MLREVSNRARRRGGPSGCWWRARLMPESLRSPEGGAWAGSAGRSKCNYQLLAAKRGASERREEGVAMHRNRGAFLLACGISTLALATGAAGGTRASTATACNPCRVGQTLSWHGTAYRVNWIKTRRRIGDSYFGAKADGTFIVVSLTLTDRKSSPVNDPHRRCTSSSARRVVHNFGQGVRSLRQRIRNTRESPAPTPENGDRRL